MAVEEVGVVAEEVDVAVAAFGAVDGEVVVEGVEVERV